MENDMRNIDAKVIEDTVARLCIEANLRLPPDVINALRAILNRPSIKACAAVTVRAICAKASYAIRCAG